MGHAILKIFIIDHKMPTMTVKPNKLYLSISRPSACLIGSPFFLFGAFSVASLFLEHFIS